MISLLDLAERCEHAEGPDRELAAIDGARALGWEVQRVSVGPDYRRQVWALIDRASGAAPRSCPIVSHADKIAAALRARHAQDNSK